MRSAFLRDGQLVVDDIDEPRPQFGQVLVRVLACGVCGSDLHFVKHGRRMAELGREANLPDIGGGEIDFDRPVYMGHEFCCEILEYGPETVGPAPGTAVVSMPALLSMSGVSQLAYTNDYPAGYSEMMLLSAPLLLDVPNGLDPKLAALTEPMAVGVHAVNKSGIAPGQAALVLGCGPVGLACIAALRRHGVETIVAADFSATRRSLATTMGATEVVDPAAEPAIEAWRRVDGRRSLVIFEAVGVPGMLNAAMRDAPVGSRVLVVGVCMEADTVQPFFGIAKELEVRFALGYDPMEFAGSLRSIAEGEFDVAPLITGESPIDDVPAVFDALADPQDQCKVLITPTSA